MKVFRALAALLILSCFAMLLAGAPVWLCAWLASFEYGFIGLLIWLVVQPNDRMSLPRALFLWWPALGLDRPKWLEKSGW